MTNLQYYKIVNKQTQEITIFEGENFNEIIAFLKENNAFPNYKTFYEIYLCFDGIHIIHGVETPAKTETRINPIFLMNKNTKEVVESMAMPMLLLFFENNNIADYELFYDDEVDNGETLAGYNEIFVNKQKATLLADLEIKYKNTRQIHIKNGYQFTIDLSSNNGKELIEKIKTSCNEIQDYNTATNFQAHGYFQTITIIQDGKEVQKQIEVLMLNWLWKYVFEEVIDYVGENKKKYEEFKKDIENSVLINELLSIDIQFPRAGGLTLNVNEVFAKLINVVKGVATETYMQYKIDLKTGVGITEEVKLKMPPEVIMALKAESSKPYPIFNDVSLASINNKIEKVLGNSFFNK